MDYLDLLRQRAGGAAFRQIARSMGRTAEIARIRLYEAYALQEGRWLFFGEPEKPEGETS